MFSSFWREALRPAAGLFDSLSADGRGVLPRADAPLAALEACGLVMVKSLIDDHPMGGGLCSFVFDFLVHGEAAAALREPRAALAALEEVDPALAESWWGVLQLTSAEEFAAMSLTLDDFVRPRHTTSSAPADALESDDEEDTPLAHLRHLTPATVGGAIVAGVRQRLLDERREAFSALRRGFLDLEDLSVQLATLPTGGMCTGG